MRRALSSVHQRFHFLFIHTDVVDCGLLLHCHLLLLILVIFERVRAHRRRFSRHSQADNMGHSERWVVDMHTHTLNDNTCDISELWSDEAGRFHILTSYNKNVLSLNIQSTICITFPPNSNYPVIP